MASKAVGHRVVQDNGLVVRAGVGEVGGPIREARIGCTRGSCPITFIAGSHGTSGSGREVRGITTGGLATMVRCIRSHASCLQEMAYQSQVVVVVPPVCAETPTASSAAKSSGWKDSIVLC
jgi:hypothetical protein